MHVAAPETARRHKQLHMATQEQETYLFHDARNISRRQVLVQLPNRPILFSAASARACVRHDDGRPTTVSRRYKKIQQQPALVRGLHTSSDERGVPPSTARAGRALGAGAVDWVRLTKARSRHARRAREMSAATGAKHPVSKGPRTRRETRENGKSGARNSSSNRRSLGERPIICARTVRENLVHLDSPTINCSVLDRKE